MFESEREELASAIRCVRVARTELKELKDNKFLSVLQKARVIGCTTSGAAKCQTLLDTAAPSVILIEEAAEIMEAHVLASLGDACKHLIMIGDHKQLRPKAEHCPLTVEAGHGFDLNRSLFERLAQTLHVSTLSTQHRMHPHISSIPRLITHPNLKDSDSTKQHLPVKGIAPRIDGFNDAGGDDSYDAARRVIFIDQQQQEDSRDELAADKVESASKTNAYEVKMLVAIVRYICQQGHKPENLVVLTPHLGQLLKLKEALSEDWQVFVGDQDFNDARWLLENVDGFQVGGGATSTPEAVRVATIDNCQGEEADIVLVSLVRSDAECNIGFFARARKCQRHALPCQALGNHRRQPGNAYARQEGTVTFEWWPAVAHNLWQP